MTLVLGSPFRMQLSPPGMTLHLLVGIVSRKIHFLLESRVFGEWSSPFGSVWNDGEQKKRSNKKPRQNAWWGVGRASSGLLSSSLRRSKMIQKMTYPPWNLQLAPENRPNPKRKLSSSNCIRFQVRNMLVSGEDNKNQCFGMGNFLLPIQVGQQPTSFWIVQVQGLRGSNPFFEGEGFAIIFTL